MSERDQQTDRHTDEPRYSVSSSRPHQDSLIIVHTLRTVTINNLSFRGIQYTHIMQPNI